MRVVSSARGSPDGHSSGEVNHHLSLSDRIRPVPCLLWLLPSRGNSMCRLVPFVQYRESIHICWSCFLYPKTRKNKVIVSRCWTPSIFRWRLLLEKRKVHVEGIGKHLLSVLRQSSREEGQVLLVWKKYQRSLMIGRISDFCLQNLSSSFAEGKSRT